MATFEAGVVPSGYCYFREWLLSGPGRFLRGKRYFRAVVTFGGNKNLDQNMSVNFVNMVSCLKIILSGIFIMP